MAREGVAILGLDGLDPSMTRRLPSLRDLHFDIQPLDPLIPLTFPSWSTILTGVNPGKHGIYDFFKYKTINNDIKIELFTSFDLHYPRIHEYIELLRLPLKYAVINPIPSDIPSIPKPSRGVVAKASFFTDKAYSNLDEINIYLNKILEYDKTLSMAACRKARGIALKLLDTYLSLIRYLSKYNFELLWINIDLPDALLHKCPQALSNQDLINSIFLKIDKIINEISKSYSKIIIVSDHGFKLYNKTIRINPLLYKYGFLKLKSNLNITGKPLLSRDNIIISHRVTRVIYKIFKGKLRFIPRVIHRSLSPILRSVLKKGIVMQLPFDIDFKESIAFAPVISTADPSRYTIILNDLRFAGEVASTLSKYGVVVRRPTEVFTGPYIPNNMLFVLPGEAHPVAGSVYSPIESKAVTANHAYYGVFAVRNVGSIDDLCPGGALPSACVVPSVLCELKAPVDSYLDFGEQCWNTTSLNVAGRFEVAKRVRRASLGRG